MDCSLESLNSAVNFTCILPAAVWYKSVKSSFFVLKVVFVFFGKKSWQKGAHKMLAKLTTGLEEPIHFLP